MLFEHWDTINWIGAGCIMALILFSCYAVLELSWAKSRNLAMLIPVILLVGMAGLIWGSAAPSHSYMEREYWTAKLEQESQQEQFEEERNAALKGLTFGEVKLTCEQIDAANDLGMGELVAPCRLSVGVTGVPNE